MNCTSKSSTFGVHIIIAGFLFCKLSYYFTFSL